MEKRTGLFLNVQGLVAGLVDLNNGIKLYHFVVKTSDIFKENGFTISPSDNFFSPAANTRKKIVISTPSSHRSGLWGKYIVFL